MTDIRQQAGIWTRVWLGGKFIGIHDPVPIQITPKRFETKTRTSNLAIRVDRVFTPGMPNIRNRREFFLPWSDLREPGILQHVDILAAIGQPIELGLWKPETDVFDGNALTKTFYLQRRQILPAVTPPTTFPHYPTRIIRYDKSYLDPTATATELVLVNKTSAEINAGDPGSGSSGNLAWVEKEGDQFGNVWRTKVKLYTAPPDALDCLVAIYLPLYLVVVEAENQRSYAQSLVEPRGFRLTEFG